MPDEDVRAVLAGAGEQGVPSYLVDGGLGKVGYLQRVLEGAWGLVRKFAQ